MTVEVVVISSVEQIVVEAPGEFSVVEGSNRFEIIELAKQGPKGAQGEPGVGGGVQSLVPGANVTIDSTDPANPIISATGGGGGGGSGNPNQVVKSFTLAGLTSVEVLRIPCPPGTGWQFSLSLGVGDINSTPVQLFAAVPNAFFSVGGTFIYDGDWVSRWPVDAPAPVKFSTMDLSADPVIDGTFMRATQVGNELVITCEPDNALAIGPCAILFEGTRNDGVGFTPTPVTSTAQLSTLAVARVASAITLPETSAPGEYVIVFDTADENPGNHFSTATGVYTVPATGKYLISVSTRYMGIQIGTLQIRASNTVKRSIVDTGATNAITFIYGAEEGEQIAAVITYEAVDAGASVGATEFGAGSTSISIVRLTDAVPTSGGGGVPPEMTSAVDMLQLGAPQWFAAPNFASSGIDIFPSGLDVEVTNWMRAPWSSCSVDWGDGTALGELTMDVDKNPSLGPQSQLVFYANPLSHTYAAPGTYTVFLIMINSYGYQFFSQDVTVA